MPWQQGEETRGIVQPRAVSTGGHAESLHLQVPAARPQGVVRCTLDHSIPRLRTQV